MDYHANIDGVTWFCEKILPTIKKEYPQVQFNIVGSNPHPSVKALDTQNGVRVTGFVEDIRPYYWSADICVIPLRMARGIQNKVLEAMAMSKPVVTTPVAVQGIHALQGEHVLVGDSPENFCRAVTKLVADLDSGKKLGQNARQFVIDKYDWSLNMKKFEEVLQKD
jgi:glycosyltransferase involved in cell wall biosynthesis